MLTGASDSEGWWSIQCLIHITVGLYSSTLEVVIIRGPLCLNVQSNHVRAN